MLKCQCKRIGEIQEQPFWQSWLQLVSSCAPAGGHLSRAKICFLHVSAISSGPLRKTMWGFLEASRAVPWASCRQLMPLSVQWRRHPGFSQRLTLLLRLKFVRTYIWDTLIGIISESFEVSSFALSLFHTCFESVSSSLWLCFAACEPHDSCATRSHVSNTKLALSILHCVCFGVYLLCL